MDVRDILGKLKRYKIGILAGGPSREREISLKSGRAVFDALQKTGLEPVFIDVSGEEFSSQIDKHKIDIAFIALHGKFGEDGACQEILDEKGIMYTGSGPKASRLALDKASSKEIFLAADLNVPSYCVVRRGESELPAQVNYPCVVKPTHEGSSIGLTVVIAEEAIAEAVKEVHDLGDDALIEDFIEGREITVGVLEEEALPVVEIMPDEGVYDFDAKYFSIGTKYVVPAELDDDVYLEAQRIGLMAHRAIGCRGFSRVDLRLSDDGKIFVLEVNTIPGLTERSLLPMAAEARGLRFDQLCINMLYNVIKKEEHCGC